LTNIINISNTDDISALVTSAFISSTYKVESTRSIVEIWREIKDKISLSDNLETVSAILALGRMMDIKEEIEKNLYINMYLELVTNFSSDLKNRGHSADMDDSKIITAMITAACISRTEAIETINEIINQWEEITGKIQIKDDLDKISSILTIGRINEYRYNINNIDQILDILSKLREYLSEIIGSKKVEQRDLAAAFITAAYLEITPKVERIQDMVTFWHELREKIKIKDHTDYVSAILASGRIRDLNAQFFLTDNTIFEIRDAIRNYIDSEK